MQLVLERVYELDRDRLQSIECHSCTLFRFLSSHHQHAFIPFRSDLCCDSWSWYICEGRYAMLCLYHHIGDFTVPSTPFS